MASGPITSRQIDGETMETVTDFIFLGSKITADGDCSHEIKRCLLLGNKAMTNLDSILKSRDITLLTKVCIVKAVVFLATYGCSHGWMWELDYKEDWALKNWCLWTVVLKKTLESPLDWKEIKAVNPKGNQPRVFIGRTDAEAEAPIFWPPDAKSWLIGKDPDAGKDGRQEEKGMTEYKMVEWHHQLGGHEFEQAPGVGDGQESLGCCSPCGNNKSDTTEWLKWTEYFWALTMPSRGFPGSCAGKESTCNVGDLGLIPGLGRSRGGRHGNTITKHDRLNVTELKFIVLQFRRLDIRD